MTKVLLLQSGAEDIFAEGTPTYDALVTRFPGCMFRAVPAGSETQDDISWADVVTGHPKPQLLKKATGLQWLHIQSAGVNGYTDRAVYGNPDIIVTRSADVFSIAMAEHAIGMLLALNREIPLYIRDSVRHKWERRNASYELCGATVLMLGTGSIAGEIVKRLQGFSCQIIGVRRDIQKQTEGYAKLYPSAQLQTALAAADYVINTLPLTPATTCLLGEQEFAVMKRRAVVINVGRGGTIDQNALIRALQEGRIAGAGLDVTVPEPLDEGSPLWDMPNVIVTPHSSGGSDNAELRRLERFAGLLECFINGGTMDYRVDFDAGY